MSEGKSEKIMPWAKLMLGAHLGELLAQGHDVLVLLLTIALRARRASGRSPEGIAQGWAKLGDYENYGLTEQRYRRAKEKAKNMELATFKATSKGTLGKLMNKRVLDISGLMGNEYYIEQATDRQRADNVQGNEQATTSLDKKKEDKRQEDLLGASLSLILKEEKFKSLDTEVFRSSMDKWWQYRIFKKKPLAPQAVEADCEYALTIGATEAARRINSAISADWTNWQYEPRKALGGAKLDADGYDTTDPCYAHKERFKRKC
ncbi:hypothetical protein ACFLS1_01420 [Verrucomicrobiota bacterium]